MKSLVTAHLCESRATRNSEDAGEFPIRVITPGFCMAHMIASVPKIKGSKIAMEKGE